MRNRLVPKRMTLTLF